VKILPKVIKEANKEKRYTVEAEYPQIDGDARFEGFNREARKLISKDVAAFKSAETEQPGDESMDLPAETQNSTLNAGYDFRYATDDRLASSGLKALTARRATQSTQVLNYDLRGETCPGGFIHRQIEIPHSHRELLHERIEGTIEETGYDDPRRSNRARRRTSRR
jgi:hypothetical protein